MHYEDTNETIFLKAAAKEALTDFIKQRTFDYFFTATFKREQRFPFTAIRRASEAVLLTWPEVSRGLIVAEPFKLSGWHCHGLVHYRDNAEIHRMYAEAGLKKLGWSQISPISNMGSVSTYCAKYLMKSDNRAEWMLYGPDW